MRRLKYTVFNNQCNYDFSGLDHDQNVKKMRILSFMQMAESNPNITFDEITTELQIEEKDVEAFIIEGRFK